MNLILLLDGSFLIFLKFYTNHRLETLKTIQKEHTYRTKIYTDMHVCIYESHNLTLEISLMAF